MLFVVEYTLEWDGVEIAAAKRLEWPEVRPETFRFVGEYIWHNGSPPFKGVAIVDVESIEDLHQFVLHYGATLQMKVHPATDVLGGIQALDSVGAPRATKKPKKKRARKKR